MALISAAMPCHANEEPASPAPLSESEYSDLRLYVNQARETLERTIENAKGLAGSALHSQLLAGVKNALEDSRKFKTLTDSKAEALLFRSILNRALELDQVYGSSSDPASASVVLLAGIYGALQYYDLVDKPRLELKLMPAPDWIAFARDQIPFLIKATTLAPTPQASLEAAKRALGWTAIDLNKSIARREFAKAIIRLEAMLRALEHGSGSIAESLQLLERTQTELASATSATFAQPTKVDYPSDSYPGSSTVEPLPGVRDADSIFPLVKSEVATDTFGELGNSYKPGSEETALTWNLLTQVGLGGMALLAKDQPAVGFGTVSAAAQFLLFKGTSGGANQFYFKAEGAAFASRESGRTAYHARGSVVGGAFMVLGLWLGFEANDFNAIRDEVRRVGWSVMAPVSIGNRDYILVRVGLGASSLWNDPWNARKGTEDAMGTAIEVQAMLRVAKFVFNVQGNWDKAKFREYDVRRLSLIWALSIPLSAIFPNDAIRVEGQVIDYSDGAEKLSDLRVLRAGLFYEVRF